MKRATKYWWDFRDYHGIYCVIVESTDNKNPIIAKYPVMGESAEPEIGRAEYLISEIKSGRLSVKAALMM